MRWGHCLECVVRFEAIESRPVSIGTRHRRRELVCISGEFPNQPQGEQYTNHDQFAKAAGATVIATTSSENKFTTLKKFGADHIVNYKDNAEWGDAVKKASPNGNGVDNIVEVGGVRTLPQSLKAIKPEGIISCVGSVSGAITDSTGVPSMLDCWLNNCIARGVSVGSREQMEDMIATVEANDIHPFVDDAHFGLHDAREAFKHYVCDHRN